jgi:adenylylsulfate kinase-like enzyme
MLGARADGALTVWLPSDWRVAHRTRSMSESSKMTVLGGVNPMKEIHDTARRQSNNDARLEMF